MVPVDHVARCVVACSFHPPDSPGIGVAQISANPRLTFTDFTDTLKVYGYEVDSVPYEDWKQRLVRYVEDQQEDGGEDQKEEHALMPLYHFVTGKQTITSFRFFLPPPPDPSIHPSTGNHPTQLKKTNHSTHPP